LELASLVERKARNFGERKLTGHTSGVSTCCVIHTRKAKMIFVHEIVHVLRDWWFVVYV
jgi:hypothetical protein